MSTLSFSSLFLISGSVTQPPYIYFAATPIATPGHCVANAACCDSCPTAVRFRASPGFALSSGLLFNPFGPGLAGLSPPIHNAQGPARNVDRAK